MRILGEVLLLALGIAFVMVVARGLQPIAPALAGALRMLANPFFLALLGVLLVLMRAGRARRRSSKSDDARTGEPDVGERGL